MKITKRQLKRIIKEEVRSSYFRKSPVPGPLTESQLNEIAPVIMGIGRAIGGVAKAGSAIAKTFTKTILPALKKGGSSISKMLKDSPKFREHAVELLQAAQDKVPDLKDVDLSTPEALTTALEGDKASVIEDVLQQAAPDLEQAVETEKTSSTSDPIATLVGGATKIKSELENDYPDAVVALATLNISVDDFAGCAIGSDPIGGGNTTAKTGVSCGNLWDIIKKSKTPAGKKALKDIFDNARKQEPRKAAGATKQANFDEGFGGLAKEGNINNNMKLTKRQLKRIIREEKAKVTKKYDGDSALIGGQDELHDELQKAIIDKTVEDREKGKNESLRITRRQLRRIIREATAQWSGLRLGREDYGQVGQPGWSWSVFADGVWQDVTLSDDEKKSVDSMLDLDVNEEDVVIEVLEQSRGYKIEDIEQI